MPSKNPPYNPLITKTKTMPKKTLFGRLRGKENINIGKALGYKTFYLKGGKKVYLEGIRERGQAIRFGETYTLKNLRATFGVQKTAKKVSGIETSFMPSNSLFRDYRIRNKRKVPLQDTFIQRRGKRLSYRGEINEIQMARRMKGRLI